MPSNPSDILWVVVASVLVFSMQAGFCALESGFVRAKNTINVALKNLTDFFVSTVLFWAFGFAVMFGPSVAGLFGTGGPVSDSPSEPLGHLAYFLFQLAFCSTAATIMSGGVAERMRFPVYLISSGIVAGIVYPVFGHWAWASDTTGAAAGWLLKLGFHDFAGSSVVHSVGGWATLAAVLHLGSRAGRFDPRTSRVVSQPGNLPLAVMGCFILLFGWIGFNGGSTLTLDGRVPRIITVTLLAAAAGALAGIACSWIKHRLYDIAATINGSLAGLVAITAGCDVISPGWSLVVGAIGGLISFYGARWLEKRRIDDAVGAFPVHALGGIWGTVAVAVFGQGLELPWWHQLGVQLVGVLACGLWSFGAVYLALALLKRSLPLRVTEDEERLGLNVVEHGASTEILDLLHEMEEQRASGDFSRRVTEQPHTETGQLAHQYNRVLDRVNQEARNAGQLNQRLRAARDAAQAGERAKSEFLQTVTHELRTPLNGILGMSDVLLSTRLDDDQRDFVRTIQGSGHDLLSLVTNILDVVSLESGKVPVRNRPYDPVEVGRAVLKSRTAAASAKGLRLTLTIAKGTPAKVHGDSSHVARVLSLLVGNAIKFSTDGEIGIEIQHRPEADIRQPGRTQVSCAPPLRASATAGHLAFVVHDSGVGIPLDKQGTLFRTFTQADSSTSRRYEGAGLGLAICRGLVQAMGGHIGFSSEPDHGSTFWFTLPLADPPRASVPSADSPENLDELTRAGTAPL